MGIGLWRFLGSRRLGITFWAPPYPKIEGGRIYSWFSLLRGPHPPLPLYMLVLKPKTCGDRTVRSLPGRYSPVSGWLHIWGLNFYTEGYEIEKCLIIKGFIKYQKLLMEGKWSLLERVETKYALDFGVEKLESWDVVLGAWGR